MSNEIELKGQQLVENYDRNRILTDIDDKIR